MHYNYDEWTHPDKTTLGSHGGSNLRSGTPHKGIAKLARLCISPSAGKITLILGMLLVAFWFAQHATAGSPQEKILLAQKLRAQGLPELALELLESEAKRGQLSPAMELERARAYRDFALKAGGNLGLTLLETERKDLAASTARGESQPIRPLLEFEQARMEAARGRLLLRQWQYAEPERRPTFKLREARRVLRSAGESLAACQEALTGVAAAQNGQPGFPDLPPLLAMERGRNALEQAISYPELDNARRRGDLLKKSIEFFDGVARAGSRQPAAWEASAWIYRCQLENDDAKEAARIYAEINNSREPASAAGKRLARAFRLLWVAHEQDPRTQATFQTECEDWLRQYPDAVEGEEGRALCRALADSYQAQASATSRKPPISARTRELLEKAARLYASLDQPNFAEADLARGRRIQVFTMIHPDAGLLDPGKVRDVVEGWMRAQLLLGQLHDEAEKLTPERRRARYRELKKILETALSLSNAMDFPRESMECKGLLVYVLWMLGDPVASADLGESLARQYPHAAPAAQGGILALQALAAQMGADESKPDAAKKHEMLLARFTGLARFLEDNNRGRPEADTVRHLASALLGREKRYLEALAKVEAASDAYADLPRLLYQGARLAQQADAEQTQVLAGASSFKARGLRLLERVPSLASARSPGEASTLLASRRLLAEFYFKENSLDKLKGLADATASEMEELDDASKASLGSTALSFLLFARCASAQEALKKGQVHEARMALAPLITFVKDPAHSPQLVQTKEREPAILKTFLDLAIRAAVLDDDPDQGKELVEFLTSQFPESPLDLLGGTLRALSDHLAALRQQGPSSHNRLDRTRADIKALLDRIYQQQGKDPRADGLLFLAESYAGLDEFPRARELAARIQAPGGDPAGNQRTEQIYRAARLLLLKLSRQQKDFKATEAILDELGRTSWAAGSLDVKRERLFLLQDQEKFAGKQGAILGWNSLMMQLQPRLGDPRIKEEYFDCYYQLTYCILRDALASPDAQRKKKQLRLAANYILKLEKQPDPAVNSCKKKLQELLAQSEPLREQYDALKKEER